MHAALTEHVGRPVRLAAEDGVSHFDDGPVHLVTTSGLRALEAAHGRPVDVRRLRPNVLVETDGFGLVEESWIGRRLGLGEVTLDVVSTMPRCVMLNLPQVGLAAEPGLLDTVTAMNDMCFGVLAKVAAPGSVSTGDPVTR